MNTRPPAAGRFHLEVSDGQATLYNDSSGTSRQVAWLTDGGNTADTLWALTSRLDGTDPHRRAENFGQSAQEAACAWLGWDTTRLVVLQDGWPVWTEDMLDSTYLPAGDSWAWLNLLRVGVRGAGVRADGTADARFVAATLPPGWRRASTAENAKWARIARACPGDMAVVVLDEHNRVRAVARCTPSGAELRIVRP